MSAERALAAGRSLRRALRQNALQGAPVHVEPAGRLGDIAAAELVDALDVLPAHPIGRHRIFRRIGSAALEREQRRDYVVGVHRLGEIVDRAAVPENPMSADRVRWEHIQRIYELCGRNVSETARRLGMHRRTLQRILAKRAPR